MITTIPVTGQAEADALPSRSILVRSTQRGVANIYFCTCGGFNCCARMLRIAVSHSDSHITEEWYRWCWNYRGISVRSKNMVPGWMLSHVAAVCVCSITPALVMIER